MKAMKCDRCGEYYEWYEGGKKEYNGNTVIFAAKSYLDETGSAYYETKHFDLCKKCMTEVSGMMRMESIYKTENCSSDVRCCKRCLYYSKNRAWCSLKDCNVANHEYCNDFRWREETEAES